MRATQRCLVVVMAVLVSLRQISRRDTRADVKHRLARDTTIDVVREWPTRMVMPRENTMHVMLLSLALVLVLSPVGHGGEVERLGRVEFKGDIHKAKNVSAITVVKGYLVVGSDEGHTRNGLRVVLKTSGPGSPTIPSMRSAKRAT